MSQVTKSICELEPPEAPSLCAPRPAPIHSRTFLKRYILDSLLPVLTLLSMSALTIVMLVVIVTTVAEMNVQLPGSYMGDTWAGWETGPVSGFYPDQEAYADSALSMDPAPDQGPWLAPSQAADPF